jgi:hypothetical protein
MTAKGWAVVGPDGHLILKTISFAKSRSLTILNELFDRDEYKWSWWEDNGYRCVRVTVTVEDEG